MTLALALAARGRWALPPEDDTHSFVIGSVLLLGGLLAAGLLARRPRGRVLDLRTTAVDIVSRKRP